MLRNLQVENRINTSLRGDLKIQENIKKFGYPTTLNNQMK